MYQYEVRRITPPRAIIYLLNVCAEASNSQTKPDFRSNNESSEKVSPCLDFYGENLISHSYCYYSIFHVGISLPKI